MLTLDLSECKDTDDIILYPKYEWDKKGWSFDESNSIATSYNYNILVALPNRDFRHLAEKIRYPLAWWESSRFATKSFREKFNLETSLVFINCDKMIVGFFFNSFEYGDDFKPIYISDKYSSFFDDHKIDFPNEIRKDKERQRRILVLRSSWVCISPIKVKYVPRAPIEFKHLFITVLSESETWKRVKQWNTDIRINPLTGRWLRKRRM